MVLRSSTIYEKHASSSYDTYEALNFLNAFEDLTIPVRNWW